MRPWTLALGIVLLAGPAGAQTYEISWFTVDGGGATFSTAGSFSVGGTIGQADAGGPHVGATFSLSGGFWAGATAGGTSPQADLQVTKTDDQTTAVPGRPITYTIVVQNLGPDAAIGATVTDIVPAAITGATWTCAGAGGGSCTPSGSGNINDTANLPVGGTATYTLTGTITASATGSLSNTATVAAPGGVVDPVPRNNSATDTDTLTPQADLSITKSDGQAIAVPGQPVTYTILGANAGPSDTTGATVTDNVPAILIGATWTCAASGGGTCTPSGAGNIADAVGLPVGATVTYTLTATVDPQATGTLANTATIAIGAGATDPVPRNNSATDIDTLLAEARAELSHGSVYVFDLASAGGVPNVDLFHMRQEPYSSYEIVIDEASGDLGPAGPLLERMAPDGTTVLQASAPVGVGFSRSLRWANATPATIDDQDVRVRSDGCTTDCGPDDTYRIRAYETTASVPRFNNSGTQVTVLLLQNPRSEPIAGTIYFWSAAGALVAQQSFLLVPHGVLALNTASVAPGAGGALSIAHDGPYDALVGKTVALEPATGFSFDTPLLSRP